MKRKIIFLVLVLSLSTLANIGPFPGGSGGSSGGGGGGGGTVTSVDMSVPSVLSISGNPITTSGTLAVGYSGTALPVANGGTGATTLTSNNVLLGNGTSAVQFVAPGTSGNLLTSNGTTWTSAAASFPTGSGTANRLTKWSSSSALTSSLWAEGATNGELQFQNFTAAKGTQTVPLFDLHPGSSTGTGAYTNTAADLICTANGQALMGAGSGGTYKYLPADTTKYIFEEVSTGGILQTRVGVDSVTTWRAPSTTTAVDHTFQDSSGNILYKAVAYASGVAGIPYLQLWSNKFGYIMAHTRGGMGIGGQTSDKFNGLTVGADPDITNIRSGCTTTINNSTTLTGSGSCLFTQDFGIGDRLSVSSASTVYSVITAINGDTSISLRTPIGDGSTQTINKKQSPFRVNGTSQTSGYFQINDSGDSIFGGATAGASVLQVKNSGVVQIAEEPASANPGASLIYGKYLLSPFEYNSGASGTSKQIDFSRASSQLVTMTGNATFTIVNAQPGGSYVLRLLQDATGSRTATWPAAVKWSSGVAPTLTATPAKIDIINLYYDGTSYYGSYSLNY